MYSATEEAVFVLVYLIVYMFVIGYSVLAYIGQGLGMFRMMRSAGMSNPWMGWVPGCNIYAMGNIADHQTAVNEGNDTRYRKKLLVWTIVTYVLATLFIIACVIVTAVATVNGMVDQNGELIETPEHDMEVLVGPSMFCLASAFAFLAFYIVYMVYYYIAVHKIYKLFAPGGAVGLTVLSVFVPVAVPIIFLVISKRQPVYVNSGSGDSDPTPPTSPADMEQNFYSL